MKKLTQKEDFLLEDCRSRKNIHRKKKLITKWTATRKKNMINHVVYVEKIVLHKNDNDIDEKIAQPDALPRRKQ
jgi:hypothetical protein